MYDWFMIAYEGRTSDMLFCDSVKLYIGLQKLIKHALVHYMGRILCLPRFSSNCVEADIQM